jgi:hypothetical protein
MPKCRSEDSLITKLENMNVGDEIFIGKSNGYCSDNIHTVVKKFPGRRYTQLSLYTHKGAEFKSLKDFIKIICITRLS